jgi:hypothetical protein
MPNLPAEGERVPQHPDAVVVEGVLANGKRCRLVDNTRSVPGEELQALLDALIRERRFGLSGLSRTGTSSIPIGAPVFAHVQLGERLYRLILFPHEARIEPF